MALCEIEDVDVVADGGAIVGGVVVAENEDLFSLACCDLCKEGEKVVRDTGGILAHDRCRVAATRVEVAEQTGVPFRCAGFVFVLAGVGPLGVDVVCDHEFGGEFGVAVRVCRAEWAFFWDGNHVFESCCVAVHGGG